MVGTAYYRDSSLSVPCADPLDYGIARGNVIIPLSSRGEEKGKGVLKAKESDIAQDEDILWFDLFKHVGLRVNVREKKWSGDTSMLLNNEDEVVSYEVEYKELIVRTSHLLLFMEKSLSQQGNSTGKAVVFGSWDT